MWLGTERNPITLSNLERYRPPGATVVRASYIIDEFRDAPLSRAALDGLAANGIESSPRSHSLRGPIPGTWVTDYSGDMGNSFGPKGLSIGSSLQVSSSK